MIRSMSRRGVLAAGLAGAVCGWSAPGNALAPAGPTIEFVSNPLADFLHCLFYRRTSARFPNFEAEGFEALPKLSELVQVAEQVASAGLTQYAEVEPFLVQRFAALPIPRISSPFPLILSNSDPAPDLGAVLAVVRAGAGYMEAFHAYWRAQVAPVVDSQIAGWRAQDSTYQPLGRLLEMHRLPFRAQRLQVVAMPFHPAGSANYTPPAVYTRMFKEADLGWVLGHEGSHLLWSEALGTDWRKHASMADVVALGERHELDIEEMMCLFMQVELSKAVGKSEPDFSIAAAFDPGPAKGLLSALEARWAQYLAEPSRWPTLIDYVADATRTALGT